MEHRWLRWAPAVVVPAVIAAAVVITPLAAGASDLPVSTPADVLHLVAASNTRSFSGTVEQNSDLGLPSLPTATSKGTDDNSAADLLELALADHTAKVWVDGPARVRVQVLDQLAERDAIRNGSDLWLYQSSGEKVTHATLPAHAQKDATPHATSLTPSQLAQRFLDAVDPSTKVSLGDPTQVAGRDAYDLVLTPKADTTLIGTVSIAVDGKTGIPLKVAVTARGASAPAFEAGFTSFSDQKPDADVFAFAPPKGASVSEQKLPDAGRMHEPAGSHPMPSVSGTGWATVVALPAGSAPSAVSDDPLFSQLTQPVDGGRALSSSILSVLVTADGRVLAGSVPVSALQAAAQASAK
ncbi:outer membrane lipoprotein carrier protein LolA [Leifsonia sp. fls2-241-R2A-40a]|uniref:LolA family protein n=1 Tax=Leifsonia sp. fls2-241-R2A-40a TaxID=3040290 RepID=UPI00254E60D8|nr:outer membrane lipoprotein carrier protein LolA [Leifsonia sp. fls2-241-R2A-40a]